jgi:two-component system sensor histidine kinase BarA
MILNITKNVNILNLLTECLDVLRFKAEMKKIELYSLLFPEVPHSFNTDVNRFKQILINLLSNAIKYTERGSVKVEVKLDEARQYFLFSVIDTGVGIDSKSLE